MMTCTYTLILSNNIQVRVTRRISIWYLYIVDYDMRVLNFVVERAAIFLQKILIWKRPRVSHGDYGIVRSTPPLFDPTRRRGII